MPLEQFNSLFFVLFWLYGRKWGLKKLECAVFTCVRGLKWFECHSNGIQIKGKHCLSSWNFTIMASVAGTKRRAENKTCKIKYKALKELEKGTAHKKVAALFGVPGSTLSTWKKAKTKYTSSLKADSYQKE